MQMPDRCNDGKYEDQAISQAEVYIEKSGEGSVALSGTNTIEDFAKIGKKYKEEVARINYNI